MDRIGRLSSSGSGSLERLDRHWIACPTATATNRSCAMPVPATPVVRIGISCSDGLGSEGRTALGAFRWLDSWSFGGDAPRISQGWAM